MSSRGQQISRILGGTYPLGYKKKDQKCVVVKAPGHRPPPCAWRGGLIKAAGGSVIEVNREEGEVGASLLQFYIITKIHSILL